MAKVTKLMIVSFYECAMASFIKAYTKLFYMLRILFILKFDYCSAKITKFIT